MILLNIQWMYGTMCSPKKIREIELQRAKVGLTSKR